MYTEKCYGQIVELYNMPAIKNKSTLYMFEVAYSLADTNKNDEAERIYEYLLERSPKNTSILNNLHILKKRKGDIDSAYDLISKAYKITKSDEIISKNYSSMYDIVEERKQIDEQFKVALIRLQKENDFVLEKLRNFLLAAKKDSDFKNGIIPIASWKFKVLMKTDEQKADSLKEQWLDRGYLRRTGDRGNYQEHVYQINPYIETNINKIKGNKIPAVWIKGIENINGEKLASLKYFEVLEAIQKIRKKYKCIIERDINELTINYIMNNYKSVVVLSGSMVETLLIYYCEKKKIQIIDYSKNQRNISKKLYDADLGDLLNYFQIHGMLDDILVHMGNISRISRNFIHPGKELRDTEELNEAKASICFISAIEILFAICSRAT